MTLTYLVPRKSDKLQQLQCPRRQHRNHLQEVEAHLNLRVGCEVNRKLLLEPLDFGPSYEQNKHK